MLPMIKIITIILILSLKIVAVEANENPEISEQTSKTEAEHLPSSIKDTEKPNSLISTEFTDNSSIKKGAKILKLLTPTEVSDNPSSTKEIFSPIKSYKNHSNSLVLSLKDAIIRTLSDNVSIAVEEISSKVKNEKVTESYSEFDATFGIELSMEEKTQQLASAFSSPNKMENDNQNWDLSLSQKLVTGADYQFNFTNNRNKTNSKTAGLNPSYSSEFELSLTQPLLKNFGINLNKRNIHIAKNEVDISDYEFETKVIDVISDVENVYWDFVFSLKNLEVKEKSLERAKDLERRVNAQVSVGTMAPIETLQAESDVASREESLLIAQDVIQDNEDKLKNILNIDFSSPEGLKSIYPTDQPDLII